jgi:formamidopyrimidine-DNA glycosylase
MVKEVGGGGETQQDAASYISAQWYFERGKNKFCRIKSFLMDQRIITGIGNIYACEILYGAGISPLRETRDLSLGEWGKITRIAASVLTKAVECRGTTVSDWRDLFGESGEYQHCLQVYGKAGAPCPRCGVQIERCVLGGRGTYYCPQCQQ